MNLSKILTALRQCSATLEGKQMCEACFRQCLVQPRIEILDDAAAALSGFLWRDPKAELPKMFKPVLIARVKDPDKPLHVEQGMLTPGGWWKVYGTNCKWIVAWMPMPEPPEEGEIV